MAFQPFTSPDGASGGASAGAAERARYVAANPATAASVLRELARHPDRGVRRIVAANPSTPEELLFKLAIEFPRSFLNNPLLSQSLRERPGLIDRLPVRTLVSLLKQPGIPAQLLVQASASPDPQVQLAVLLHPALPASLLALLARCRHSLVAGSAKLHVNAPGSLAIADARSLILASGLVLANPRRAAAVLALAPVPDWLIETFRN